jgi:LPS-assembly protein
MIAPGGMEGLFGPRRQRRRARARLKGRLRREWGLPRRLCALVALSLIATLAGVSEAQNLTVPEATFAPGAGSIGPMGAPVATVETPAQGARAAPARPGGAMPAAVDNDTPVTFQAEEVEFERETGILTARGRVEAWQGERFVRADEFRYDRGTGIATLRGNVQVLEADGQAFYAEEAELGPGFRDGVLREIRARLVQNARLAGTGARRTDGTITDVARVVYSSCNLCENDPTRPPLWQLRARMATQDRNQERISYRDAVVEVGGVPVLYTPFFSHPDPQTPRASGFLFPNFGYTRFLGAFAQLPYFWAIDDQQDLLATVTAGTEVLPNLSLEYRRRFNNGDVRIQGSAGYFTRDTLNRLGLYGQSQDERFAWNVAARGAFHLNQTFRAGFDINRASSEAYLRTYRLEVRRFLVSTVFLEGFWNTEGYMRLDARAYQGLRRGDNTSLLPYVAPNVIYEHAPRRQILGGFLTADIGLLGISREIGSMSQRLGTRIAWERPINDPVGGLWTVRVQSDLQGYYAEGQQKAPGLLPTSANGTNGNPNIRAALDWRMPFVRSAGEWGQQIIEPRIQVVTGPSTGMQLNIPNEDSIDFDFTDANLFQLNRFTGRDRQEGGTRVDAALRGQWNFPNGGRIEGLVGRSYRFTEESVFPVGTGLDRRWSDWVGRVGIAPVSWLEVMGRTRLDGATGSLRVMDTVASVSVGRVGPIENVTLSGGYLYTPRLPYFNSAQGRNEVSFGVGGQVRSRAGGVWRANAFVRYDLRNDRPSLVYGSAGYEDECFIFEARLLRRFAVDPTTNQEYRGNTVLLFRIGLKTVGEYGLRAI